jgi:16S rRNA (cytosine1402-N4)-methyltransferase
LAEIIPWPPKEKAKIFQALRIETNKELEVLEDSLNQAISLLKSDWIIFVISFHSLEDRITKQIFKKETRDCICSDIICSCNHTKSLKLLQKKPILPSEEEISQNSRSRSAKARSAQKL